MGRSKLTILPKPVDSPESPPKHTDVSATVAALNRVVHEPARLAILTVLSACQSADFVFLRTATGLTAGNLSIQLSRLEQASLIEMERTIENRRTLTMVRLTGLGTTELNHYWTDMESLRQQVRGSVSAEERKRRPGGTLSPSPA